MDQKAAVRWGPDGYLRPDQFLDHLTVIIMLKLIFFSSYRCTKKRKSSVLCCKGLRARFLTLSDTGPASSPSFSSRLQLRARWWEGWGRRRPPLSTSSRSWRTGWWWVRAGRRGSGAWRRRPGCTCTTPPARRRPGAAWRTPLGFVLVLATCKPPTHTEDQPGVASGGRTSCSRFGKPSLLAGSESKPDFWRFSRC